MSSYNWERAPTFWERNGTRLVRSAALIGIGATLLGSTLAALMI